MNATDTQLIKDNLKSLLGNLVQLVRAAKQEAATLLLDNTNEVLWNLNRPITRLNQWFRDRNRELRKLEKKRKEDHALQLEVERMDSEGGSMMPTGANVKTLKNLKKGA